MELTWNDPSVPPLFPTCFPVLLFLLLINQNLDSCLRLGLSSDWSATRPHSISLISTFLQLFSTPQQVDVAFTGSYSPIQVWRWATATEKNWRRNTCGTMFMLKTNGMLAVIPHNFPPNCGSLWREDTPALMYFLATFVCLHLKGESKEKLWGKKTKQTAQKKNILLNNHTHSTFQSSKSKVSCRRRSRKEAASGASWGRNRRWPIPSSPAAKTSVCA